MLTEPRRRAYLDAMQVVQWLPRTELPFAAPSRPGLLECVEAQAPEALPIPAASAPQAVAPMVRPKPQPERLKQKPELPRPSATKSPLARVEAAAPKAPKAVTTPVPRFALQLLRAGRCLVLVELPTGDAFQSRDPGYLLLKDMLRAAGLPDSPQLIGDPVRWPLLVKGTLDQGPEAAKDFVQGFVSAQLEIAPCACLWLVGLPALRFAGGLDDSGFYHYAPIDGLCNGWALPGLETLMDEPHKKADVWHAMRRVMTHWIPAE